MFEGNEPRVIDWHMWELGIRATLLVLTIVAVFVLAW